MTTTLFTAGFILASLSLVTACGQDGKDPRSEPVPQKESGEAAGIAEKYTLSQAKVFGIKWTWVGEPKAEVPAHASLTFATPDGAPPASVAEIVIDPWMPSMGHGTYTDDQTIAPVPGMPGAYLVDGLYFIMGGPWEIRVSAVVNGVKDGVTVKADLK